MAFLARLIFITLLNGGFFYLYKSSINWFLQSIQNLANELLLYIPLDHIKSISLSQLIQISLLMLLWSFILD